MSSIQLHKPSDHHQACHDKNKTSHNDHSLTHKVKEIYGHKDHHVGIHKPSDHGVHHEKKKTSHDDHCLTHKVKEMFTNKDHHGSHVTTEKKKKSDGHCIPKMNGDHSKKNKIKKNKERKHGGSDSSSDSSSDSENEKCNKKKY